MSQRERPRILLVDDQTFLLECFSLLLKERCEIVGTVTDGHALLDVAPALRPDVILLDIEMPRLDGIEAARRLKPMLPDVKIVFLTGQQDPEVARQALLVGASGYVLKTADSEKVLHAIDEALAGRFYMSEEGFRQMAAPADRETGSDDLTPRQREVLTLLAQGKTMKEAAKVLHVAPRTIADHKYRMMGKLRVSSSAELVRYAFRHRLVC